MCCHWLLAQRRRYGSWADGQGCRGLALATGGIRFESYIGALVGAPVKEVGIIDWHRMWLFYSLLPVLPLFEAMLIASHYINF